MQKKFKREIQAYGFQLPTRRDPALVDAELVDLPRAARRYFEFMQVVGKPRDWSFCLETKIDFRLAPDQPFTPSPMIQYNTRLDVARIFHMRGRFKGLPVYVRDTYVQGRGRMLAKLLGLVPVVDESGEKLNIGELVTYLNDAVLFAPTFLLGPEVRFVEVNDKSFDVLLRDRDTAVKARVFVNEAGAPVDFSTTDRFGSDPKNPKGVMVRCEWRTPVGGWREFDGRKLPTSGSAVWRYDSGDFEYARLAPQPGQIRFNVAPGGL